jgi:hypothetical protein
VNSEEIQVSLKAEFESYLKEVSEGFKEKLSQLQANIDEQIDRHKAEFGQMLNESAGHFDAHSALKPAFLETVAEHLKLARDEGSQITANAFAEAEKYDKEQAMEAAEAAAAAAAVAAAAEVSGGVAELRDAIKDVTEKHSQVEILKSLIQHAAEFAPRGAFFVLKNERFGGWRTFGKAPDGADDAVKQVSFAVSAPSVINEAVKFNAVKESAFGEFDEDTDFLQQVAFGEPEKMYAVPLVVRGRSVAVLYADSGDEGAAVNVAALDTLVQVASLRVELLASLKGQPEPAAEEAPVSPPAYITEAPAYEVEAPSYETAREEAFSEYTDTEPAMMEEEAAIPQPSESFYEDAPGYSFETETVAEAPQAKEEYSAPAEAEWRSSVETFEPSEAPVAEMPVVEAEETAPAANGFDFQSGYTPEPEQEFEVEPSYEASPAPSFEGFAPVAEAPSFTKDAAFESFKAEPQVEEVMPAESGFTTEVTAEPVSTPVRSRLSERNVDLPIEVSDEERRLHNDARRFARLLVSEIKLYNEQKVKEGRESGDIYDRLQEAVDRSREMYDKRVQPAVAGRFDYFHYELVNALAEGDESKLGGKYPGANI